MYLFDTKTGEAMRSGGMFQPEFTQEELDKADRLEVWATSFDDRGEYCDFNLMSGDTVISSKRVEGY